MFLKVGVYNDKVSLARADPLLRMIRQSLRDVQVEKKLISNDTNGAPNMTLLRNARRNSRKLEPLLGAVIENKVDFGVFNLKDLPIFDEAWNVVIAATPERSSPYDVLVTRDQNTLKSLKPGSIVGASTLLRIVQIRRMRPDLKVEPISGGVEERLTMLDKGEVDAIILAESGLARLGMSGRISERLSLDDFMPSPGQGITALVCRRDNQKTVRLVRTLDNPRTRSEAETERELLRLIRLQSKIPLGAYASTSGEKLHLSAFMVSSDGMETLRSSELGSVSSPLDLARRVADSLFRHGALKFEEGWGKLYPLSDD